MKIGIKTFAAAAAVLVLTMTLIACGNKSADSNTSNSTTIRVGTKDFTENLIVGELYALALEDVGYQVKRVPNIAGSVIHTSLVNNEIDLYPEYTGTGLTILKMSLMTNPDEGYTTVKAEYEKQFQVTWLNYSQANDGAGLVIRTDVSKKLGITTISDLQKHASELRFASQGEVDQREDGIPALEKVYEKESKSVSGRGSFDRLCS
ncbi:glycine betaine ABC transporter substrate-binding protein [Paenibacillus sp. Soil766]|uniref:glycine betaine ABC transporter substrate-binding protein n=1 Tax=Paenibacillus sp. Soil766 TaxID=1736404 RepID=UPI0009E76729|nr:glycine betaine ABC transporter substrate-binding protein [Paenibacillus sp. Soil766]